MGLLLSLVGAVLIVDQLTKLAVLRYLPLHVPEVIIPGFFNLVHVRNKGAAFSLLAGMDSEWRQVFFVGVAVVMVALMLLAYRNTRQDEYWNRTAYALIIGGAIGNLVDRVRLGEVIDFLDVYVGAYHWPTFNVADSAISTGAVMLLIALLRGK